MKTINKYQLLSILTKPKTPRKRVLTTNQGLMDKLHLAFLAIVVLGMISLFFVPN